MDLGWDPFKSALEARWEAYVIVFTLKQARVKVMMPAPSCRARRYWFNCPPPSTFSGPQLLGWVLSVPCRWKCSTLCSIPVQVGSGCEGGAGRQGLLGRTGCSTLNKTHPTTPTRGKRTARAHWILRLVAGGGASGQA